LLTFVEVHSDSICRPFFGIATGRNLFYHVPGIYHDRSAVVAFADGHVEKKKWLDARTYSPPRGMAWHDHAYTSVNNRDLTWLQERASVRN
ncbi:MAG: hypothetical protein J0L61_13585, partial [Planctomycetes bacterium]|nr:hypothetical protein [Planctomycetota bacterium]